MIIVDLMREVPAFKKMVFVVFGGVAILVVAIFSREYFIEKEEFYPYSAKVKSFYIEKHKYGGVYYQRIEFDNKETLTANGFSAMIDGQKTRLIDYISVGDSVSVNAINEAYVYRNGSNTYHFSYNPADFK